MRLPTKARFKMSLVTVLASGAVLAGCGLDSTAPVAVTPALQSRTSPFTPTAAAKALVGVVDGSYTFTVDPTHDQGLILGVNYLRLPANSICDFSSSTYGGAYWNDTCVPQTTPVIITAIVRDAATDHPSIDFFPAMRFSPDKTVTLYMYVPIGMDNFQRNWVINYCPIGMACIDESLADPTLRSYADENNHVVFRRIKHFSGYVING